MTFLTRFKTTYLHFIITILISLSSAQALAVASFVQFADETHEGLQNMECTQDVATTSNGRFVYAISFCDSAINIFERNLPEGQLNLIESIVNDDLQQGIQPSDHALISPDNQHLYVFGDTMSGGQNRRAIFVYQIDENSGSLSLQQIFDDMTWFDPITSSVITANGHQIYIGSQAGKLYSLNRAGNGQLSRISTLSNKSPTSRDNGRIWDLQLSPNEDFLYASIDSSNLVWFSRNSDTGALAYAGEINNDSFGEENPIDLFESFVFSPDDSNIYGLTSSNKRVIQLNIGSDRALSFANVISDIPEGLINSPVFSPKKLIASKNGKLVYFVDNETGVQVWERNSTTGLLNFRGATSERNSEFPDKFFSQMYSQKFSPDGFYIYGAVIAGLTVTDISVDTWLTINSPVQANLSSSLETTVHVSNDGMATAHNVEVAIDTQGFTVTGADITGSSTNCTISGTSVTCNVHEITVNGGEVITLQLTTENTVQTGSVNAVATQDQLDKSSDNNQSSTSIIIGGDSYNPVTGVVHMPSVTVGDETYDVYMQHLGDLIFEVSSATLTSTLRTSVPTDTYDSSTGVLHIPSIVVGNEIFNVVMMHHGNLVFSVTSAENH